MLTFEDFTEGRSFPLGPKQVSAEEIIEFASEFDPQPFHLDEDAGKASILGGLSASGWHTCSMMMRMIFDSHIGKAASEGGPGMDYVNWRKPVLAGDILSGETTVITARVSKSRPHLGFVTFENIIRNQKNEVVLECRHPVMIRRKADDAEASL